MKRFPLLAYLQVGTAHAAEAPEGWGTAGPAHFPLRHVALIGEQLLKAAELGQPGGKLLQLAGQQPEVLQECRRPNWALPHLQEAVPVRLHMASGTCHKTVSYLSITMPNSGATHGNGPAQSDCWMTVLRPHVHLQHRNVPASAVAHLQIFELCQLVHCWGVMHRVGRTDWWPLGLGCSNSHDHRVSDCILCKEQQVSNGSQKLCSSEGMTNMGCISR